MGGRVCNRIIAAQNPPFTIDDNQIRKDWKGGLNHVVFVQKMGDMRRLNMLRGYKLCGNTGADHF
ncbi:hypothetical protein ASD8599_03073 [Ascidiaceihabitans donghaensis]|uniref:Uncharacterized protein n=1 Tax=Ascidiaceihabitans donghaensis TaxID=1510460 RepID=A0A2R8BGR7_9RHOB|nr:hypothetical protein ASD8599_03073 [Ascidiaceihabitans donghaensis]